MAPAMTRAEGEAKRLILSSPKGKLTTVTKQFADAVEAYAKLVGLRTRRNEMELGRSTGVTQYTISWWPQ